MSHIIESIKERRSVRSYDGHLIDDSIKEKLADFIANIKNPFDIPVAFKFLDAKECDLNIKFVQNDPMIASDDMEYVASYNLL